ncbi:NAD(P)H-dependent oxidoreductase [Gulosibacter molinativorax]|uniref:NAD(P)H dehydrogenase n=1 Tax=Gulosibacter molinativorax TaxID=256821 RepID=A0ABT7CAQ7_9MICO|nr:NAD(P)H-dependent oxidoreductase [Gulosibacter molinativorax]MDJ1372291.1 NAD(P)H dehydrogenase [Gulosibacter molinativorax]QUY63385.1 Hypotetical protein [Gulosibacter molinativorax]
MTSIVRPRILIVVAHPVRDSHTWRVAGTLRELLGERGASVEIADLHGEEFNPVITAEDLAHYAGEGRASVDIVREHERLSRQDAVIMLSPMYWWTVSAMLKGWIDRVFTNGWAFGHGAAAGTKAELPFSRGGFVLLTSGSVADLDRHGYSSAAAAQLPYGVLSYCGRPDSPLLFLEESEAELTPEKAAHWRGQLEGFLDELASENLAIRALSPSTTSCPIDSH